MKVIKIKMNRVRVVSFVLATLFATSYSSAEECKYVFCGIEFDSSVTAAENLGNLYTEIVDEGLSSYDTLVELNNDPSATNYAECEEVMKKFEDCDDKFDKEIQAIISAISCAGLDINSSDYCNQLSSALSKYEASLEATIKEFRDVTNEVEVLYSEH